MAKTSLRNKSKVGRFKIKFTYHCKDRAIEAVFH